MLSHTIACWLRRVVALMHQTKPKTPIFDINRSPEFIPIPIGGPDYGPVQPRFLGNPNR